MPVFLSSFPYPLYPCNYFYIPKTDWQHYGGQLTVISYFYEKFKSLYRSIWEEFLELVDGTPPQNVPGVGDYWYSIPKNQDKRRSTPAKRDDLPSAPQTQIAPTIGISGQTATYKYSRLCFKANVIEPLGWGDSFCVFTPEGTYSMTKQQFYEVFPNVVETASYKLKRIFHYRKTPQKAMQFKLDFSDPG